MNDSEVALPKLNGGRKIWGLLAQTQWWQKDLGSSFPNITGVEERQDGSVTKHEMQPHLVRGEEREGPSTLSCPLCG